MTYKILNKKTGKILHRFEIRSAQTRNKNYQAGHDHPDHDLVSETTNHPENSCVHTNKDYKEKESGRPRDKSQPFIYSTKAW